MRRLALYRFLVRVLAGVAFLGAMLAPHLLRAPQPPLPTGNQACKEHLWGKMPRQLRPHECWEATASWYGAEFDGDMTASGVAFNMDMATAAHRSLPLGSIVRVSNPETGKSLVLTINDRGPFVPGRSLDVSYQVARVLGFAEQGLCRVKIELLKLPKATWLSTRARN